MKKKNLFYSPMVNVYLQFSYNFFFTACKDDRIWTSNGMFCNFYTL